MAVWPDFVAFITQLWSEITNLVTMPPQGLLPANVRKMFVEGTNTEYEDSSRPRNGALKKRRERHTWGVV